MKTSVYLKNITGSPSSYYCITQYMQSMDSFEGRINGLWPDSLFRLFMKPLFRKGFGNFFRKGVLFLIQCFNVIRFMIRDIYIYQPDTVIICREVFPQKMLGIFSKLYKKLLDSPRVIWLFDDNIVMGEISLKEWDILCKYSNKIMVTHDYLKDTLPKPIQKKVSYIPQADGDIKRELIESAMPVRNSLYDKEIHLIWAATGANLPNMYYISESLEKAATILKETYQKKLVLNVVCNLPYKAKHMNLKVNNIVWTREEAIKQMSLAHIGIMPLIDNEFNRGKGGFKLVQYLTADLPVIASNVGYTEHVTGTDTGILVEDLANPGGWVEAILLLSTDKNLWTKMGIAANKRCTKCFSFQKNLKYWEKLVRGNEG